MTTEDIEREWQYRYDEAIAIGRTETRARDEADAWKRKLNEQDNETASNMAIDRLNRR